MNRYPLWAYISIAIALALGLFYTLPNFYGERAAIQVSSARTTIKIDESTLERVQDHLRTAQIPYDAAFMDATGIKLRFPDGDTQLKARDVLDRELNPEQDEEQNSYAVTPTLLSASPKWMRALGAEPMSLGLDLRGGVHLLLQVDMDAALTKRLDNLRQQIRGVLRDAKVRASGASREGNQVVVRFSDEKTREAGRTLLLSRFGELAITPAGSGEALELRVGLTPQAAQEIRIAAVRQNISTLNNRVNALGVSEPVIQQQGNDRIVVQLPGVLNMADAIRVLGRTATMEVRMVDEIRTKQSDDSGGADYFPQKVEGEFYPIAVEKEVIITGERFSGADSGFDQHQRPVVVIRLDSEGGQRMRDLTRQRVGDRMAIILFEKGKGEVISAARINEEFGDRFQISGDFTTAETNELSLLIKAGSLAAPMDIIETRLVGPSLGKANIEKGFDSTKWGFIAIIGFMVFYYAMFGVFSAVALGANLLLLIALLSGVGATVTLPGIAAIALTLGMAIDANVLINERIREELRGGKTPQAAISVGYERAFGTILDSNITTLIAGGALWLFGSGPIRGFATVHCLGIITSIFSAVIVSRALVNLYYGSRRKIDRLAIGNTSWK
jgi:preprotein translocase subunit SecD